MNPGPGARHVSTMRISVAASSVEGGLALRLPTTEMHDRVTLGAQYRSRLVELERG